MSPNIDNPAYLRKFDESELTSISEELRAYLIESVGRSGGHFGAGLGVIELTVALHYLYDTPNDRLVWDVVQAKLPPLRATLHELLKDPDRY